MYMIDDTAEHFEQSSSCNFNKLLGGVPKLERLSGHIYFTKFLSIGNGQMRNAIIYHHLKSIELNHVSFNDLKEVLVVLQLIMNSPNLKELQISEEIKSAGIGMRGPDSEFWEETLATDCMLQHLKTVKLTEAYGLPHEMKLIKFLLEHSPRLETMSITRSLYATEGRLNMLIDLVSFQRAPPQASILFIHEPVGD